MFRRWVAVAFGLIALHLSWMLLDLGGTVLTRHVANFSTLGAAVIAAVVCLVVAARRSSYRRTWLAFGLASLAWGFGQGVWTWFEMDPNRSVPTPSLADLGFLAFVPFACWGALTLSGAAVGFHARARAVLDGLTVGGAVFFLGWLFTVGPVYRGLEGPVLEMVVNAAYPIGDLVVATVGLSVLMSARSSERMPRSAFALLGMSLVGFLVSDTAFLLREAGGTYSTGNPVDTGFFASFVLLAFAALAPGSTATGDDRRSPRLWGQILPSIGAAVVLTIVMVQASRTDALDTVSVWLASALIVLVLVRQIVAVLEQRRFAHLLQARVDDRTEQLSRREEQFRALVQHSSDVIMIVDAEGSLQYVSPSVHHVLGYTAEELDGQSALDLAADGDRGRVAALLTMAGRREGATMTAEWKFRRADGAVRQVEVLLRNLIDEPAVAGVVLNLRDVTDRKELEDQLTHQALHDDLTGLPNRTLLRERIEQAVARWLFKNEIFSLVVVDIDDFKSINDSLGHVAGDAVLKTVAERLTHCTRRGDTLVRLGGDEFAILLDGVDANDPEAHGIAELIITSLSKPMRVEGRSLALRGSVGLACVNEQVSQADDLLRNADLALHAAKSSKRGGYAQFEVAMHDFALRRVELEDDLRRAMDNDELQLYYQPTVDLPTGKIEGVEALLRWPHPEKGFISPADFIPVAEESGLIVPLGTWVLKQACNEMTKWQTRYPNHPPLILNVNLSGRQLAQPDIVETVRAVLEDSGLAPGTLVLEMTESVLLDDNPSTLAKMQALVDLGVQLAIDDFGTGYSSLSYLRQFPINVLKIDRAFVSGVGADGSFGDSALVQAIVDLAGALDMRTVAEGIETREQLDALRAMGCQIGQGFFIAKPAPAEEVRRLIEQTLATGSPVPAAAASS